MKNRLFLMLLLALIGCSNQEYKFEKQLFEGLASSLESEGLDIRKELYLFENQLIENGILKDNSGNSYYDICKQIEFYNDINCSFDYSFLDTITIRWYSDFLNFMKNKETYLRNFEINGNSKAYKKSKQYTLSLALDSLVGDVYPRTVARVITSILSPKDFEQDYYKMMLLLMIVMQQENKNSDSLRILPPIDENKGKYIKQRNVLHVKIIEDTNFVYFNDSKISIDDLAIMLKEFMLNEKSDPLKPELELVNIENIGDCYRSKYLILLLTDKNAKYKTFNTVQNQIFKAINLARNEMAIKHFEKEYEELNDIEKEAIEKLVPLKIKMIDN